MCIPVIAAALTTVGGGSLIAGAGAVAGLASAGLAAKSSIDQGRYAKGVASYNAQVARNQATETRNAGVDAEMTQRQRTKQLISQQRAALGASGLDMNSGSPLQLQQDAERLGTLDALRIRDNFNNRATALETGATLTEGQGALAQRAGFNQAAESAISGASSFAGKWYDNKAKSKVV